MRACDIIGNYKRDEIKTVICQSDGEIKYCNALSINGTCLVREYLCELAVAVVVEKDGFTQYLAIEH